VTRDARIHLRAGERTGRAVRWDAGPCYHAARSGAKSVRVIRGRPRWSETYAGGLKDQ